MAAACAGAMEKAFCEGVSGRLKACAAKVDKPDLFTYRGKNGIFIPKSA